MLAQSVDIMEEQKAREGDDKQKRIQDIEEEEKKLMEQLAVAKPGLMSAKEYAKGVSYDTPMPPIGDWRPLPKHRSLTEEEREQIREKFSVECAGKDAPPPIRKFEDMRFPQGILNALTAKGITRPTNPALEDSS